LFDKSYAYNFFNQGIEKARIVMGSSESYEEYLIRSFDSEKNKEYNKEYFRTLKELSYENNFTLVLLVFPMPYNLKEYPFMNAHKYLAQVSEEFDFPIVDLLSPFQQYDEKDLVVSKYDYHPSELGYEITAKEMSNYLLERGLDKPKQLNST
jgi:hypothetical protein